MRERVMKEQERGIYDDEDIERWNIDLGSEREELESKFDREVRDMMEKAGIGSQPELNTLLSMSFEDVLGLLETNDPKDRAKFILWSHMKTWSTEINNDDFDKLQDEYRKKIDGLIQQYGLTPDEVQLLVVENKVMGPDGVKADVNINDILAWRKSTDVKKQGMFKAWSLARSFMFESENVKEVNAKENFIKTEFKERHTPFVIQSELRLVPFANVQQDILSHNDYKTWHAQVQPGETKFGFLFLGGTGNNFRWERLAVTRLIVDREDGTRTLGAMPLSRRAQYQMLLTPLRDKIDAERHKLHEEIMSHGFFGRFLLRVRLLFRNQELTLLPSRMLRNISNLYNIPGTWDLYNIIEDSELGRRTAVYGILNTRSGGEFNEIMEDLLPKSMWIQQRARWISMQTLAIQLSFLPAALMFFGQYLGFGFVWGAVGSFGFAFYGMALAFVGLIVFGEIFYQLGKRIFYPLLERTMLLRQTQYDIDPVKAMGRVRFQFVSHLASSTLAGLAAGIMFIITDLYLMALVVSGMDWLSSTGTFGLFVLLTAKTLTGSIPLWEMWLITTLVGATIFASPQVLLAVMSALTSIGSSFVDEDATREAARVRLGFEFMDYSKLFGMRAILEDNKINSMDYSDDQAIAEALEIYINAMEKEEDFYKNNPYSFGALEFLNTHKIAADLDENGKIKNREEVLRLLRDLKKTRLDIIAEYKKDMDKFDFEKACKDLGETYPKYKKEKPKEVEEAKKAKLKELTAKIKYIDGLVKLIEERSETLRVTIGIKDLEAIWKKADSKYFLDPIYEEHRELAINAIGEAIAEARQFRHDVMGDMIFGRKALSAGVLWGATGLALYSFGAISFFAAACVFLVYATLNIALATASFISNRFLNRPLLSIGRIPKHGITFTTFAPWMIHYFNFIIIASYYAAYQFIAGIFGWFTSALWWRGRQGIKIPRLGERPATIWQPARFWKEKVVPYKTDIMVTLLFLIAPWATIGGLVLKDTLEERVGSVHYISTGLKDMARDYDRGIVAGTTEEEKAAMVADYRLELNKLIESMENDLKRGVLSTESVNKFSRILAFLEQAREKAELKNDQWSYDYYVNLMRQALRRMEYKGLIESADALSGAIFGGEASQALVNGENGVAMNKYGPTRKEIETDPNDPSTQRVHFLIKGRRTFSVKGTEAGAVIKMPETNMKGKSFAVDIRLPNEDVRKALGGRYVEVYLRSPRLQKSKRYIQGYPARVNITKQDKIDMRGSEALKGEWVTLVISPEPALPDVGFEPERVNEIIIAMNDYKAKSAEGYIEIKNPRIEDRANLKYEIPVEKAGDILKKAATAKEKVKVAVFPDGREIPLTALPKAPEAKKVEEKKEVPLPVRVGIILSIGSLIGWLLAKFVKRIRLENILKDDKADPGQREKAAIFLAQKKDKRSISLLTEVFGEKRRKIYDQFGIWIIDLRVDSKTKFKDNEIDEITEALKTIPREHLDADVAHVIVRYYRHEDPKLKQENDPIYDPDFKRSPAGEYIRENRQVVIYDTRTEYNALRRLVWHEIGHGVQDFYLPEHLNIDFKVMHWCSSKPNPSSPEARKSSSYQDFAYPYGSKNELEDFATIYEVLIADAKGLVDRTDSEVLQRKIGVVEYVFPVGMRKAKPVQTTLVAKTMPTVKAEMPSLKITKETVTPVEPVKPTPAEARPQALPQAPPVRDILTVPTDDILPLYKGDYGRRHAERVKVIAGVLASEMKLSPELMHKVETAAAIHDFGAPQKPIRQDAKEAMRNNLAEKGAIVPKGTSRDIDLYEELKTKFTGPEKDKFTQDEIDYALDQFQGPAALDNVREKGFSFDNPEARSVVLAVIFHHHIGELNAYLDTKADLTEAEKEEARLITSILVAADTIENGMNLFKKIFFKNEHAQETPAETLKWLNKSNLIDTRPIDAYRALAQKNAPILAAIVQEARTITPQEEVEIKRIGRSLEAPKMQFPKGTLPIILLAIGAAALLPVIYYLFGANVAKTYWTTASVSGIAVLMTLAPSLPTFEELKAKVASYKMVRLLKMISRMGQISEIEYDEDLDRTIYGITPEFRLIAGELNDRIRQDRRDSAINPTVLDKISREREKANAKGKRRQLMEAAFQSYKDGWAEYEIRERGIKSGEGGGYEGYINVPDIVADIISQYKNLASKGVLAKGDKMRILDIGCGKGKFLRELVELPAARERFRKEGIELEVYGISPIRAKGMYEGMTYVEGFAEYMPEEWSGKFHYVISVQAMRYSRDPLKFVEEAHRVLAPYGKAIIDNSYYSPNYHMSVNTDSKRPSPGWEAFFAQMYMSGGHALYTLYSARDRSASPNLVIEKRGLTEEKPLLFPYRLLPQAAGEINYPSYASISIRGVPTLGRLGARGTILIETMLLAAGLAALIWAASYVPAIPAALGALMAGMAILPEKAEGPEARGLIVVLPSGTKEDTLIRMQGAMKATMGDNVTVMTEDAFEAAVKEKMKLAPAIMLNDDDINSVNADLNAMAETFTFDAVYEGLLSEIILRQILAEIAHDLNRITPVNIDELLTQRRYDEVRKAAAGYIAPLKQAIAANRRRFAMTHKEVTMPIVETKLPDTPIVIATTEKIALCDPLAFTHMKEANEKRKDVTNCLIYGDEFKTAEEAQAFVRESGYEGKMIFVNKNDFAGYNGLIENIASKANVNPGYVGIRTAQGEIQLPDKPEILMPVLEIPAVEMEGREPVYYAFNTYQHVLRIVTKLKDGVASLDDIVMPGISYDMVKKVFIYLIPVAAKRDLQEIELYRRAVRIVQAAA
ncbi:MAG: methyltransferase domain-containing protein [Candidatus Omnitrophica bacterium]|nr:methyltransferase domain-containing protein [Candidatus Omnitrophota bacterium]